MELHGAFSKSCLSVGLCAGLSVWKLENSAPVTSDTDRILGCETEFTLSGFMGFTTWSLWKRSFDPFSPMLGSVAGVTMMSMIPLTLPPSSPPGGSLSSGGDRAISRQ